MPRGPQIRCVAEALWELFRYDLVYALLGFRGIQNGLKKSAIESRRLSPQSETAICRTFVLATSLYWKPVRCLQRSVALARMLRRRCTEAEVVIAYVPDPFFSHAWVEVDGRVVNELSVCKERLNVLQRL